MKRLPAILTAALLGLLFAPSTGMPADMAPFHVSNRSPLVQIFGLPAAGDARVLPEGQRELALALDLANHFIDVSARREQLVLDGETVRLSLAGRMGIGARTEIGFELPWIRQGGGFLDGFIESYHRTFGFPQGGRDKAPGGRILFQYQRNGVNRVYVGRSGSGIGDVRLGGGVQLIADGGENPRALALRASLKLPTGNSGDLHGSGSTDLALWLAASRGWKAGGGHWGLFGGAGVMGMTDGDVLPDQQKNAVALGSLGAGWQPLAWLTLKVQLDGHTAFYRDSDLAELGSASVQAVLGGTLHVSERTALDIGVAEDLAVKTAPDVVFHFALRHRF
ncbi:MAG: DUF3187 family protein [Syntrophaceae bacterium]|nr:DUF3187 family protein [Syntrophaceae bacterium]